MDMVVLAHIKEQSRLSLGSYGRPRMTEELKEVEARLAKINADPKQRAALRARVEIGKDHQKTALKFWNIMHPLYVCFYHSDPLFSLDLSFQH